MGSQSLARGLQAKKKLLTSRPEEGVECFHKDGSSLMITDSSHIFSHDFVEVSEVLFFFKILIDALQSGGTINWYIADASAHSWEWRSVWDWTMQSLSWLGTPPETLVITPRPLPTHTFDHMFQGQFCADRMDGEGTYHFSDGWGAPSWLRGSDSDASSFTVEFAKACLSTLVHGKKVTCRDLAPWLGQMVTWKQQWPGGVRKWRNFKFEDEIIGQNEAQEIGDVNRICDDRQSKKLGVRFQVWGWVQEWLPPWSWNPHLARWFWDPVASPQVKTWTSLRL